MSIAMQHKTPKIEEDYAVTAEKIVAAVQRIVTVTKPVKVRAFGSRARGDHRPDSDLDLAIIVKEKAGGLALRQSLWSEVSAGFAVDMLVMTQARYDFMKDSIVSVQRDIFVEGVTLYDASDGTINRGVAARLAA